MRKKLSFGIYINGHTRICVFVDGEFTIISTCRNDENSIRKTYSDLMDTLNDITDLSQEFGIFFSTYAKNKYKGVEQIWLDVFAKARAIKANCSENWFSIMVDPYFDIGTECSDVFKIHRLTTCLEPEYKEEFKSFSDLQAYQLTRFADMVGDSYIQTEQKLRDYGHTRQRP